MSKRKLSAVDYRALNAGSPIRSYPPDGNRAQVQVSRAPARKKGR